MVESGDEPGPRGDASWRDRLVSVPGMAHALRAVRRYVDHRGYQQAAAITYFSVLSLVPAAMVALSVVGYLLAGHPVLLRRLQLQADNAVPVSMQPLVAGVVESAVDHRFSLGLVGVAVAVYSGWNWMSALRDSLTGMWRLGRINESFVATVAGDCLALLGLGLALLVVFGATVAGSDLGVQVLGLATPGNPVASTIAVSIGSEVATLGADWLIFWWVLAKLPRIAVSARAARGPALATAAGFELLKHLANVYLQALGRSPTGVALGSIVGVLVFAYLVSRLMLLAAAWIATNGARLDPPSARARVEGHPRAAPKVSDSAGSGARANATTAPSSPPGPGVRRG